MLIWATVLTNPGIPCTIYDIAGIAKEAYNIAFSKKNMESTFKATEVFPLNRDIYTDEDFLPAEVINRPNLTVSDETQQIGKLLFILLILQRQTFSRANTKSATRVPACANEQY